MKIIEIVEQKVWDGFLITCPYRYFLQTWEWGCFEEAMGKKVYRLGFQDSNGKLIGVCMAVEEPSRFGNFIYCPRGPVVNWDEVFEKKDILMSLIAYFKGKNYFCIRLDPNIKNAKTDIVNEFKNLGFKDSVDFIQVERAWMLDIQGKTEEELLLGMRKKARYSLKKAMKCDIEIGISEKAEDFEKFVDILEDMAIRKGFPSVKREYLLKQFEMLGGFLKFFYAKQNDEIIAGGFFAFYGEESSYLRGATSENVSSSQASYLLQWEAIKHAQKMGIQRHNFWGVVADKNYHPRYPAFGYSNFKKGFGGYLEEYMRAKDFAYNMVKYNLLRLNQVYRKFKYKGCN